MLETPPSRIDESVASWELLHSGTAAEFIDALCRDALRHPAVDHPYLRRLAAGDLPDVRAAIRDYCHQYHAYSAEFPSYLEGVIEHLESRVVGNPVSLSVTGIAKTVPRQKDENRVVGLDQIPKLLEGRH